MPIDFIETGPDVDIIEPRSTDNTEMDPVNDTSPSDSDAGFSDVI